MEKKNRSFLSYIEGLVVPDIFEEVEAALLPTGHTHVDID